VFSLVCQVSEVPARLADPTYSELVPSDKWFDGRGVRVNTLRCGCGIVSCPSESNKRQETDEEVSLQNVQSDHAVTSQTAQRGLSGNDSATPHAMVTLSVLQTCANGMPP
jgi:hypothetical protein